MANKDGAMSINNKTITDKCLPNNDVEVVDLDSGDPRMYVSYWKKVDDECSVTIKASDLTSYFSNPHKEWEFALQMPEFTDAVHRIHRVVGNAVTKDRHIIKGTGSSQLFMLTLRALASSINTTTDDNRRIPVVCAEPCYWRYAEAIEEDKSGIFEWRGDANTFQGEGPYIEVVTVPNHPDGLFRKPVVNREGGIVIYDLVYYWPQYTPIVSPADYDIMLFGMSKATGHAGSRVGWAIVKDGDIAAKIMKQISLLSLGTCRESQVRATRILEFVADSYEHVKPPKLLASEGLFEFGHRVLTEKWEKLKVAVDRSGHFKLPDFPLEYCNYQGKVRHATPAFAWMECKTGDAKQLMTKLKIRARSGATYGDTMTNKHVRISMLLDDDEGFNLFTERLASLSKFDTHQ